MGVLVAVEQSCIEFRHCFVSIQVDTYSPPVLLQSPSCLQPRLTLEHRPALRVPAFANIQPLLGQQSFYPIFLKPTGTKYHITNMPPPPSAAMKMAIMITILQQQVPNLPAELAGQLAESHGKTPDGIR